MEQQNWNAHWLEPPLILSLHDAIIVYYVINGFWDVYRTNIYKF